MERKVTWIVTVVDDVGYGEFARGTHECDTEAEAEGFIDMFRRREGTVRISLVKRVERTMRTQEEVYCWRREPSSVVETG